MTRLPLRFAVALTLLLPAPASAEIYRDRSVPGCVGVTAEYAKRSDGQISVKNTCIQGGLQGTVEVANGTARIEGPGRLSVTFVPWLPFARGDYWVLHLEPDYSVAVVGAPKGTTGWILARTPQISAAKRARAEQALVKNGYDISRLRDVLQK